MLYTIIEEKTFEADLDALIVIHQRIYDVKDGAIWALAHDPQLGESLPEFPEFRVYETDSVGATPSYRILYRFDGSNGRIYLHSISPIVID